MPRYEGDHASVDIIWQERARQEEFESLADMIRKRKKAQVERDKVESGQNGDLDPDVDIKEPSPTATPNN